MEVGFHVMVCDVHLCLRRKGLGDLGRNWLDAGDERIEKNIVQVCFCEGVMLSTAPFRTASCFTMALCFDAAKGSSKRDPAA